MEYPSRAELKQLTVKVLRQMLSKASLPQGGLFYMTIIVPLFDWGFFFLLQFPGLKDDLITRLITHYEAEKVCFVCTYSEPYYPLNNAPHLNCCVFPQSVH